MTARCGGTCSRPAAAVVAPGQPVYALHVEDGAPARLEGLLRVAGVLLAEPFDLALAGGQARGHPEYRNRQDDAHPAEYEPRGPSNGPPGGGPVKAEKTQN